jgi:vacuolar-type H+-ATPase subunit H
MLPKTASYQDCLQELLRKEEQVASQLRDAHEEANRSIERAWREAEQIKASTSEEAEKQASEIIEQAASKVRALEDEDTEHEGGDVVEAPSEQQFDGAVAFLVCAVMAEEMG